MTTLESLCAYWHLDVPTDDQRMVEIPNVSRNDLGGLFAHLGFTSGAEIGVAEGRFSEILCLGHPGMHLLCVDAWRVLGDYGSRATQDEWDRIHATAVTRTAAYDIEIRQQTSMDALSAVEDGSLDFVYIDANHDFLHVTQDLCRWSRKVRVGGIIAGHDYRRSARNSKAGHVTWVVDALTDAYGIRPWFLLGRKWAVEGETRDHDRSFLWVKDGSARYL